MSMFPKRQLLSPWSTKQRSRNKVGDISQSDITTGTKSKRIKRNLLLLESSKKLRMFRISVYYWEKARWKSSTKLPTKSSESRGITQLWAELRETMKLGSQKYLKTACRLTKSLRAISRRSTKGQIICNSIWKKGRLRMKRWQMNRLTQLRLLV